jgi:hypothetical protein
MLKTDAPIHFRGRGAKEPFKMARFLDSIKILFRRAKKRKMAIPVRRPQKPFIRRKDIAVTCGCLGVLLL